MNIMIVFMLLHYGDHKVTMDCIESIKELGYSCEHAILVLDNDASPSAWECTGIEVVKTGNVGFSEANNIGYKYAKEQMSATMVVAGNNDLIFDAEGFPEDVLLSYETREVHVVSPDVVKVGTGEHQSPIGTVLRSVEEVRKTIRLNRLVLSLYPLAYPFMKKYLKGATQIGESVPGYTEDVVPCGACIVFTKKYIDAESKLFYPETKFYYEEYILAKRCRNSGYKIVYNPSLRVGHIDAASSVATGGGEYRRIRLKMQRIVESAGVYLNYNRDQSS